MSGHRRLGGEESQPKGLARSLDQLTRSLGGPDAKVLASLFADWEGIVGGQAAAHSWPISLVGGLLVIGVDQPGWATQLAYLEGDLRHRMEAALGPGAVSRIEVRVRPR